MNWNIPFLNDLGIWRVGSNSFRMLKGILFRPFVLFMQDSIWAALVRDQLYGVAFIRIREGCKLFCYLCEGYLGIVRNLISICRHCIFNLSISYLRNVIGFHSHHFFNSVPINFKIQKNKTSFYCFFLFKGASITHKDMESSTCSKNLPPQSKRYLTS